MAVLAIMALLIVGGVRTCVNVIGGLRQNRNSKTENVRDLSDDNLIFPVPETLTRPRVWIEPEITSEPEQPAIPAPLATPERPHNEVLAKILSELEEEADFYTRSDLVEYINKPWELTDLELERFGEYYRRHFNPGRFVSDYESVYELISKYWQDLLPVHQSRHHR